MKRANSIESASLRELYIRRGIIRPHDDTDPPPQPANEGRVVFRLDDVGRREHERIVGTAYRDWRHPLVKQHPTNEPPKTG